MIQEEHYCKNCKSRLFLTAMHCQVDIIINGCGFFHAYASKEMDDNIHDAQTPKGPFECVDCGARYDTMDDIPVIQKREITLSAKETDHVIKILTTEPSSEEECMGEDTTYTYTADFGHGVEMDIKVCGVQFKEGESNLPWTEAVLFQNGAEVCCSEPSTTLFGIWELEDDDQIYQTSITGTDEGLPFD